MDTVIGLGEIGKPLFKILSPEEVYPDTIGIDINSPAYNTKFNAMNICIPYSDDFIKIVQDYISAYNPSLVIIHSTVPIGTTSKISDKAVHSPILGKHDNMEMFIRKFDKWVGGKEAHKAAAYLNGVGINCIVVDKAEETEALKLMCLAKYGMSIAFAEYQRRIADIYDFPYIDIIKWDANYNRHVDPNLRRPIIYPLSSGKIGGHCIIPNVEILNKQHPDPILEEILKYQ